VLAAAVNILCYEPSKNHNIRRFCPKGGNFLEGWFFKKY
jgi:hypothetical protein